MNSQKYMIKGVVSEMSAEDQAEYENVLAKLHACVNKDSVPCVLALAMFSVEMTDILDL